MFCEAVDIRLAQPGPRFRGSWANGQKIHLAWLNGKTPFNLDDGRKIHSAGHSAWLMGEWPNGLSARQLNNRLDIRLGKKWARGLDGPHE